MTPSVNLPRPRGIFFDLDGTLVDTAPDLGGAANAVLAALGRPTRPLGDYRPVASAGARGLLGLALGIGPDHPDFPRHRDDFLAHYAKHLADNSPLFEGFDTVLAAFEKQGIRWGVMTNKPQRYTTPLMDALGLSARAAAVVSADEVAQAKPAPDGLLLCCARAGLAPAECWYVGDDARDIHAGRAAGMRTVAAGWGYEGAHPIASWQADVLIQRPLELLDLIA